jgi:hypothetical protein
LLVAERSARPDQRHINQRAGLIEQTLAEFGVPAKVVGFQVGPTVTQFAVEPGFIEKPGATEDEIARLRKVRVSQIVNLRRDLALAGKTHVIPDKAGMERLSIDGASELGALLSRGGFTEVDRYDGHHEPGAESGYPAFLRSQGYDSADPWTDYVIAGGGLSVEGRLVMNASFPIKENTGWKVAWTNLGSGPLTSAVTTFALCAGPGIIVSTPAP